jgi:hypothetical protein
MLKLQFKYKQKTVNFLLFHNMKRAAQVKTEIFTRTLISHSSNRLQDQSLVGVFGDKGALVAFVNSDIVQKSLKSEKKPKNSLKKNSWK